jgi:hypothetical protein
MTNALTSAKLEPVAMLTSLEQEAVEKALVYLTNCRQTALNTFQAMKLPQGNISVKIEEQYLTEEEGFQVLSYAVCNAKAYPHKTSQVHMVRLSKVIGTMQAAFDEALKNTIEPKKVKRESFEKQYSEMVQAIESAKKVEIARSCINNFSRKSMLPHERLNLYKIILQAPNDPYLPMFKRKLLKLTDRALEEAQL